MEQVGIKMTAPKNPPQDSLGFANEFQYTYPELLDKLYCTCTAGAQIRPSPLPSATINIGDIIADHARILTTFASAYGVVVVILKMIACIIDVLCCIANPFCLIAAIIRLFGTCLPDFLLLFPQLAIPAFIICFIKIVLAIIEYILKTIVPIIEDIIQNIKVLKKAIEDNNDDVILAIAFKVAALIKDLFNIFGILAVLNAIYVMIKALMLAGIGLPCGGDGGSCDECGGENICPPVLQNSSFSGVDGRFIIFYGNDGFSFQIQFYSVSRNDYFKQMKDFFPKALNYDGVKSEDDVPYNLKVTENGSTTTYIVTSTDFLGYANLYQIPTDYVVDGYLTNVNIFESPLNPFEARFNTKTETFDFSLTTDKYITIQDTRGQSQSQINGGSWKIQSIYDGYNILLKREDDINWSYGAPEEHLRWKLEPSAPTSFSNKNFELNINHEELIRHGLIGIGCHPAVKQTKLATKNRFPDLDIVFPSLPDFDALVLTLTTLLEKVGPSNIDVQYVLDNYVTISEQTALLYDNVSVPLNTFKTESEDYVKQIYPVIFNQEADGYFSANPQIQTIGNSSYVRLVPLDRNGGMLDITVPSNIVEVEFETDFGTLTSVERELDSNGNPTGGFYTMVSSSFIGTANLKALVGGRYLSYFNGASLIPKEVSVQFISGISSDYVATGESTEPLGKVK